MAGTLIGGPTRPRRSTTDVAVVSGRVASGAAAIAAALLVAACSGADLQGGSLQQSTGSTQQGIGAVGGVSPSSGTSFSPFSDGSDTSLAGAREVIKNPSVAQVMQAASSLPEMTLGRADAPVTIIKYASMTCPYCRKFELEVFPEIKRRYIDTGKVRFIIREFPIGFQSGLATIALRCAPASKYFQLYHKLMAQQGRWVSQEVRPGPILKVAGQVGVTPQQFDACRANQKLVKSLAAIKDRGRTLGIIGTPNFFINGKLVKKVLTLKDVQAIVDPILAGGPATLAQKS